MLINKHSGDGIFENKTTPLRSIEDVEADQGSDVAALEAETLRITEMKMTLGFEDNDDLETRKNKLQGVIMAARGECNKLIAALRELKEAGYDNRVMDQVLFRAFIIERFFDESEDADGFLTINYLPSESTDPFLWVAAWCITGAMWLFCFYWCLVWGIKNGEDVLLIWFHDFGLAVMQDIVLFIPLVCFFFYSVDVVCFEPQMRHIEKVLSDIIDARVENCDYNVPDKQESILQHTSAACRAARSDECKHYTSSAVLQKITDNDSHVMRFRKHNYIGNPLLFWLASMIILCISGLTLEIFVEFTVPIIWTGFVIGALTHSLTQLSLTRHTAMAEVD